MAEYKNMLHAQRAYFSKGECKDVDFRIRQLKNLHLWICEHEREIMDALYRDLNKSPFEAYATEIGIVKEEIQYTLKHLRKWAAPKRVKTPITQFPSRSFIYPEPYGVALIMSPWNYPFQLTVAPLVGAVCAGNCAVVKPSAYSPNTTRVIAKMVRELFPAEYIFVVEGGREANQALLDEKFDYIFFTGSVTVGKYVMEKAAAHLTPVSLELGGKSPCIVDETADLKLAAKRIVWGKFLNSGQTCVAPDYILVQKSVKDKLIKQIIKTIRKMYGKDVLSNEEYPKMINEKHFDRVIGLMEGAHIAAGGESDRVSQKIAPTVLDQVTWESPVMQEEIFGPLLPVLAFYDLKEAVQMINARPRPLALYYFTKDKKREAKVLKYISYGGGCINDTVVHLATSYMPFGGVGSSGMGGYHGKDSFDTFTHRKSVMKKSLAIDIPIRYAPFKNKLALLKKIQ
ncbi:MAG: aldehyde dehydrogenase [Dorea sp.]|jgi:aldehyde dehydrogenase (NAD+)|nr:aldehyde dehydrogenase [Dorea sp.]